MYLQMLWLTELFSHFKQLNGFSSVWILLCVFKLCEHLNFFSHFKHLNGFSSAWILPCVFKCWMTELLFTLWAAEWFFINMNSSMMLQIVWTPELLFTLWAAEWFFISMNTFMCLQMLWLTELLFTLLAAEWFLASVDSFMYLYLADWNECLATFWATDLSVANFTFYDWQVVRCTLNFHKIFFVVHGGSTIEFVPELKKRYFTCVMKIFSCICVHAAEKVRNVKNNAVIKCVIRALSICTSKNLVFPDFLIWLNRKSGFFFTKTWPHASGLI